MILLFKKYFLISHASHTAFNKQLILVRMLQETLPFWAQEHQVPSHYLTLRICSTSFTPSPWHLTFLCPTKHSPEIIYTLHLTSLAILNNPVLKVQLACDSGPVHRYFPSSISVFPRQDRDGSSSSKHYPNSENFLSPCFRLGQVLFGR